jgi:hypothetical protein
MIKVSLMVEATAPTYGLSIWATSDSGKPTLRWAEGLEDKEIAIGESAVAEINRQKRAIRRSAFCSLCLPLCVKARHFTAAVFVR